MNVYICTSSSHEVFSNFNDFLAYIKNVTLTPSEPFWIDFTGTLSSQEMSMIQFIFDLHPLTVDDILNGNSTAKWELFNHYLFIMYFIRNIDNTDSLMSMIICDGCVLTFHESESNGINEARQYFTRPVLTVCIFFVTLFFLFSQF